MTADGAALQQSHWRRFERLSSGLHAVERFLERAGFDRAPWVAVAFAAGIGLWFVLDNAAQWLALATACIGIACASAAALAAHGQFPYIRQSLVIVPLAVCAGSLVVWGKSELVGTPAISKPMVLIASGRVMARDERPSEGRARVILAMRDPDSARPMRIRLNLPADMDSQDAVPGAVVRVRARLMPPAPPMLPGGYDFARTAWFSGLAATGSALSRVEVVTPAVQVGWLGHARASLTRHVLSRMDGSDGAIAAAFVTGDQGAIPRDDDKAMRDAGLAHLLSISGLHVSAVIGAVYLIALRLLALWPWLALRVRLPLVAAGAGALAGIGYTLLTGSEVPTVRSCIAAILVLAALALGREALSLRMLAVGAMFVMVLWPEAVTGPSFQMSFAAVIAIVAFHASAPARRFLGPREEGMIARGGRHLVMLLATGVVIELALMPIGLFHFHRAGVYGALANVVAIPLTTAVTMPLVALALLLDAVGAGAPAWWLAGKSLDLLLALAHWTASQPGAVTTLPVMGRGSIALFVAGGLWLALWRGQVRLLGLVPVGAGLLSLLFLRPPDLLVSGDGRHVAIVSGDGRLYILRDSAASFATDNLAEIAGMDGPRSSLADWPGAVCNTDFCTLTLQRGGRDWRLLVARGRDAVPERALAAACERVDVVIADRWLPRSCRPVALRIDRRMLDRTGGLTIALAPWKIRTVAETQGEHGWWRNPARAKTPGRAVPVAQPTP